MISKKIIIDTLKDNEDIVKCYLYFTLAIVVCLMAETHITNLFSLLVENCIIQFSHFWSAVIVILLTSLTIIYLLYKCRNKNLYIQHKYICVVLFLCLFNVYFRVFDSNFVFWGAQIGDSTVIAITDVVYMLLAVLICMKIKYKKYNVITENKYTTLRDAPIEDASDDFFGYNNMTKALLKDLNCTDVSQKGFTVGISGKWGVGKSSFLNLLEKQIKENGGIVARFYPRNAENYKAISSDFFEVLSEALNPYHTGAWSIVNKYARSIKSLEGEGWVYRSLDALDVLFSSNERNHLEKVISQIGRKIFIIIEDLDRLTAKEIIEVLKLMDRNGNFRNTFFITAYDKDYTNDVLSSYLGFDKSQAFTDKYFNYEFSLPAHSIITEKRYVLDYLSKELEVVNEDAINKNDVLVAWNSASDKIIRSLGLMRHVKRFINILMSRLPYVKNDVDLYDFLLLTLLRYKDMNVYYMLSEGELVVVGGGIRGNNSMIYLKEDVKDLLDKRESGWDGTYEVLRELFPPYDDGNYYNLDRNYKRIRMKNSFDMYFFDESRGRLNYRELSPLFFGEEDNAINKIESLYNKDKISLYEFLLSRNMQRLGTEAWLVREMKLLLEYTRITGDKMDSQVALGWFMGREAMKEAIRNNIVSDEIKYKDIISKFINEHTPSYPIELGGIIIKFVNAFLQNGSKENFLFSRQEYISMAIWIQKCYFNKFEEDNWSFVTALLLSDIKQSISKQTEVDMDARKEFLAFLQLHTDYVVKRIVESSVSHTKHRNVTLSFIEQFAVNKFFPIEDFTFEKWINEYVTDTNVRYVLKKIYERQIKNDYLVVPALIDSYDSNDFDSMAEAIRQYENGIIDNAVVKVLTDHVGIDLNMLCKEVERTTDEVKDSLLRLNKDRRIEDFWVHLKSQMEPFRKGDFVRMTDDEFEKAESELFYKTNAFEIEEIDYENNSIKISGIDAKCDLGKIEAIPIDGKYDAQIYYDPIIAASTIALGQSVPTHHTDYTYFREHFKRCIYEGKTFDELLSETDCQFVHEVQHWLKEMWNDDRLRIKKY